MAQNLCPMILGDKVLATQSFFRPNDILIQEPSVVSYMKQIRHSCIKLIQQALQAVINLERKQAHIIISSLLKADFL